MYEKPSIEIALFTEEDLLNGASLPGEDMDWEDGWN